MVHLKGKHAREDPLRLVLHTSLTWWLAVPAPDKSPSPLDMKNVLILHALEANMPFTVAMAEAAEVELPNPGRPDRSCLQVTP